jgi:hypothetical protein
MFFQGTVSQQQKNTMSDFYQILKREIEPIQSPSEPEKKEDDFPVKKSPVDNSSDKTKKVKPKKIKSVGQTKKISSTENKKKTISIKKTRAKKQKSDLTFLSLECANPIWLTMAEAAKLGGIQKRTIKRAVRAGAIKYRIVESRYQVDLRSVILYFFSKKKLWNKLMEFGIGQYVEKWKE